MTELFIDSQNITCDPMAGPYKFVHLESLDLRRCCNVKKLPGLNTRSNLRVLNLRGCSGLEGKLTIIQLENLQYVDFEGCGKLNVKFEGLKSLVHIFHGAAFTMQLDSDTKTPYMNRYDLYNDGS